MGSNLSKDIEIHFDVKVMYFIYAIHVYICTCIYFIIYIYIYFIYIFTLLGLNKKHFFVVYIRNYEYWSVVKASGEITQQISR